MKKWPIIDVIKAVTGLEIESQGLLEIGVFPPSMYTHIRKLQVPGQIFWVIEYDSKS